MLGPTDVDVPHQFFLMIKFQNVTKTYKGSTVALQDCSVDIDTVSYTHLTLPTNREV